MRDDILALKRDRILQEASNHFYERGFNGTTLDDIAAGLGVTKPFIYTHFRSKTELLDAVCYPSLNAMTMEAVRGARHPGTPTEKLQRIVADLSKSAFIHHVAVTIFVRDEKNFSAEVQANLKALRRRMIRALILLLEEGAASGEFNIGHPALTALAIRGMVGWTHTWTARVSRAQLDTFGDHMATLALRLVGIAADAPKEALIVD